MPSMDAELTRETVLNQIRLGFSEADARVNVELVPEVTTFAILTLAKRVAELTGLVGNGTEKVAHNWATLVILAPSRCANTTPCRFSRMPGNLMSAQETSSFCREKLPQNA